ncbi:hypothetical protein CCR94_16500 [Rhodoblastus sphagnicola]|uniref:Integrase n=1 Tax=Rhodoblastus sphagnicola TaxID=333368 RepID=A0A2S6N306_9HYPH|nr:DDE-type integrase/transposase/recombinase [Rhodoblastus sphagnicola]MBB4199098.1 hypothetical protein [Rhodoblastus sphagnicola]PPQ28990.1 hypothetical protein CCR94_16500 [Rhodoblastus sphagnicola]
MKSWLTTSELAVLALPGFPSTRQGWDDLAAREAWAERSGLSRDRQKRGGGVEYHVDLLPPAVLAAYVAKATGRVVVAEEDRLLGEAFEPEQVNAAALEHRDARLALVCAADRIAKGGAMTRQTADTIFCAHYNAGKVEVDDWVRTAVKQLSPRSLRRWRDLRAAGEIGRLAVDRGVGRRGKGVLDAPEVRGWLLGYIALKPHSSAQSAHDYLRAQFPEIDVSVVTVSRALTALKDVEKVALSCVTNPDAYKSKYEISGANSNAVSRLNELWLIDASPADVMLTSGRHQIYACIDRFSRRTIIYVTKTPRSEAVCLLLRRALLAWGVPERIKTDNGSDFKARRTVALMEHALKIEVNVARAYDPKAKAHVERVIKTFQHDCASDLPGFVGHNVGERKVIEERRSFAERMGMSDDKVFDVSLDAKAFQAACDHWAGVRYEHRKHGGDDMGRMSPFQKAASYQGSIRKIDDVHALDLLMAPIAGNDGVRTVSKKGVRTDNSVYMVPAVLPGTRVFVRMDPADLGRIFCFSEDGLRFLGEGVCPEMAGVDPSKLLAQTKTAQAALLAERTAPIRRELRDLKKNKPALAAEIARREAEAAGKLIALPRPTETYSTSSLEAARAAIDGQAQAPAALSPAQNIERITIAPLPVLAVLPETRHQRFARAKQMEEQEKSGIALSIEDARWLAGYRAGSEYRALVAVQAFAEQSAKK